MTHKEKIRCPRCGYDWTPRTERPKFCPNPKCHAPLVEFPEPKKTNREVTE